MQIENIFGPTSEELLVEHLPRLQSWCRNIERRTRGLASAEDLCQDVCVKLMQARYNPEKSSFATFMFMLARYVVGEHLQYQRRKGMTVNGGRGWKREMEVTPIS